MLKKLIKKFVPDFLLSFYHYCWALMGAFFYLFPSKKLTVIGITGTSGKSTVVELSSLILEQAGFKVASLSSIKFKIGDKEKENKLKMTMPGRMKIQKFLKQAVKADCKYAILEVTSEGIKQSRHKFIDFNIVVFTNLTPEHIESHGSFEKYKEAKLQLFKASSGIHIINIDDKNYPDFWKVPAEQKIGYSLNKETRLLPERLNLFGQFNLYNALAATKIALSQGVSLEVCKKALEKAKGIPGRMEIIIKEPFTVIVDYAHTPEALEQVYKTLKDKRMICVLGSCGGGRDKWKRSVLGKLAAQYCDKAIITNEDPYDEDPMEIINQVAGNTGAEKILDRKQAIKKALQSAQPGDVKNNKKIPWSDKQIILDFFKE
jgi:UDP-N-acetylmuramoyl-L-alanyl-D-glutamate--2,6-diaminopimelate ligase